MKLHPSLLLGAIALAFTLALRLAFSASAGASRSLPPDPAQVQAALQRAPLLVIQNVGQFAPQARFQVRGAAGGGTLWLAQDALWLALVQPPTQGVGPPPTW